MAGPRGAAGRVGNEERRRFRSNGARDACRFRSSGDGGFAGATPQNAAYKAGLAWYPKAPRTLLTIATIGTITTHSPNTAARPKQVVLKTNIPRFFDPLERAVSPPTITNSAKLS